MASLSASTIPNNFDPPSESKVANQHLSYPTLPAHPSTPPPTTPPSQPRQLLKDRLYVGNLHPTVDEYALLQIFSKFGKVTKLDFLFHKTGLMKGKPRGYAFVEYGNKDDALKALGAAHDKLLRGRKLIVTFAHQAPLDQTLTGSSAYGHVGGKHRKGVMDVGKPTTLSILKSAMGGRHDARTKDKIALMEAKLRQMESTKPKTSSPDVSSSTTIPYHPSLPLKPPTPISPSLTNDNHNRPPSKSVHATSGSNTPLPSLPIPQIRSSIDARSTSSNPLSSFSRPHSHPQIESSKPSGLIGVRIVKVKEK